MEVHLTPEQEALLSKIANYAGTDVERLVKDAVLRLVEEDARFRTGVERGIAASESGEFVDHREVWANVEKILQS
jgi:predicted transcriptional regulator